MLRREFDTHVVADFKLVSVRNQRPDAPRTAIIPADVGATTPAGRTASTALRGSHFDLGTPSFGIAMNGQYSPAGTIHGLCLPRCQRRLTVVAICSTVIAGTSPTAVTRWPSTTALNEFDPPTRDGPVPTPSFTGVMKTDTFASPSL